MEYCPRELFALAAWIQTFPEFDVKIYNGGEDTADAERLIAALDTSDATKYVTPTLRCVALRPGNICFVHNNC